MATEPDLPILLVDDELDSAQAFADSLRGFGWAVEIAGNVDDAWRRLLEGGIGAVVIEWNLRPGRRAHPRCAKGIELVRRLRQAGFARPIAVVTAMDGEPYRAEALAAGADEFLSKGHGLGAIVQRLRTILSAPRKASAGAAEPGC